MIIFGQGDKHFQAFQSRPNAGATLFGREENHG